MNDVIVGLLCIVIFVFCGFWGGMQYQREKMRNIKDQCIIERNFRISVDPNKNWIKIQTDPNILQFRVIGGN